MNIEWPEFLLLIVISGIFVFMAGKKLLGKMRTNYKRWGYPIPFMYGQAIFELVGVAYLWQEDVRALTAMGLLIIPFGAITTNTRYYEPGKRYWLPAFTFLMLGVLIWWTIRS